MCITQLKKKYDTQTQYIFTWNKTAAQQTKSFVRLLHLVKYLAFIYIQKWILFIIYSNQTMHENQKWTFRSVQDAESLQVQCTF